MAVDLTIYMSREGLSDPLQIIQDEKIGDDGFSEVGRLPVADLDADLAQDTLATARCWVKKTAPHPPAWAQWLAASFDFQDKTPETQSSGCIVAIAVADRIFALCFGTAHHAIDYTRIEHDFGLKVALNAVDPKRLRAMVTKTIDVKTRQTDTRHITESELLEFALDLDTEWLRSASGRSVLPQCSVVGGSIGLQLKGWKGSLAEASEACTMFLETFKRGTPEVFSFADNVKPIPTSDPIHQALEGDLIAALQLRHFGVVSIGIDATVAHRASSFALSYKTQVIPIDGLDDASVKRGLDDIYANDNHFDGSKIFLVLRDDEAEIIDRPRLASVVQMEIDRGKDYYVRVEGRWFRCVADYISRVNARISSIKDLTGELDMPTWDVSTHPKELDFNTLVAIQKGWLLQDQKLWWRGREAVEPCDLLTRNREFIHVKEGDGSSALSHLFGQTSGAADLLRRHAPFAQEMKRRYEAHWNESVFDDAPNPTFVLGIARQAGSDAFGNMLLSRINVLEHARRIQIRGYQFAICKIDMNGPRRRRREVV